MISSTGAAIIFVLALIWYGLFQLHLLPDEVASITARLFFYPTMPLTYLSRRHNYWTLIDSHVFIGAAPIYFLRHVEQLHARGVRGVINLCSEYSGPVEAYRKLGIEQLYLPTIDHREPTLEDLERAVHFIEKHKTQKSRVYIHCKAGKGRSAAVAFCWLLYDRKWTLDMTQEYLSSKRAVRTTLAKQSAIQQFYNQLNSS